MIDNLETLLAAHPKILRTLGTVLTLMVTLSGPIPGWLRDLSSSASRRRLLEDVTKRVEFWDLWVQKSSLLGPLTDEETKRAKEELGRSSEVIYEALRYWPTPKTWTRKDFESYLARVGWIPWLFMRYELPTEKAKTARWAVYLAALMPGLLWVIGFISFAIFRPGRPHPSYVAPWLWAEFFVMAIVYRFFAFKEERKWLRMPEEELSATPQE